jgi:hypothetical protein
MPIRFPLTVVAVPLFLLVGSGRTEAVPAPAALYVSTAGNDAWSGKLAAPDAGKTDGPFRTLERARDELRTLKKAGKLAGGATVWVRGGEYYLTETFALSAADSGAAEGPIVYRAYRDEKPILVGGAQVTGFAPHQGKTMKADLKALGLGGLDFKRLFCDGKRQLLARYPNFDAGNPYAGGFLYAAGTKESASKAALVAPPEGIRNWRDPSQGEVWVFPGTNYWNNIVPIRSVDPATRTVSLAKETSYAVNPGDRYFYQGFLEELDAPGEWYLDRATSTLYFWPPTDLAKARVSVPRVKTIVSIAKGATEADGPQHLTIQGFTIEGCDGTAVAMSNARRCSVVGCVIRNAGSGVSLSACKECLAYGNDVYATGGSGVTAYSGNRNPTSPDANRLENNYIHHTGYFSKMSSAVATEGVGNVISHNLIHDCPRIAIAYNGNDHVIEYNHLRHMNLETQDSGATYCLGRDWTNRGHLVRYNYVHDTLGYGRHGGTEWHSPFFTFSIYLDDWSSGQHVYGNIVARSFLAGIDNHSGRDNVVENNILYDCYREQFRYQAWPTSHTMLPDMLKKVLDWPFKDRYPGLARHKDAVEDSKQSYDTFQRNILSYGRPGATLYAVSGLDYATTTHDYNLIWRRGEEPDASFAKMRENGLDLHSVVADPKLRDPDNGDFTLAPDSPALKLGFEPIPFEKIGPYKDPRRASWPIVEAEGAREHPHTVAGVARERPKLAVLRRTAEITVDGKLGPSEWQHLDRAKAMVLAQEPNTNLGAKPPSYAWLAFDDEALYVGLWNELKAGSALKEGHQWGGNDGAEVCLQRGDGKGPVLVLQGYPDGYFQSKDDAGAPRAAVDKIGRACRFAAAKGDGYWTGEWRIPFAAADLDPKSVSTLRFNLGVRKTAGPCPWICWVGTGSASFLLESAGEVLLPRR